MVDTFDESTTSTSTGAACLVCGTPTDRDPGLCSTHCRAEADLELRRNRDRLRELRRGGDTTGPGGREIRGLLDRNAALDLAIIETGAFLSDGLHGS